jgi:hypothetical protein
MKEVDIELFKMLNDIMHVVSRELDRYSGHLRQYIVDDKVRLSGLNLVTLRKSAHHSSCCIAFLCDGSRELS